MEIKFTENEMCKVVENYVLSKFNITDKVVTVKTSYNDFVATVKEREESDE